MVMMKRLSHIVLMLVAATLLLLLSYCSKPDLPEGQSPVLDNDTVIVSVGRAVFRWTVDYPGKIASAVELGVNEDLSDAVRYGSEEVGETKEFEVTVDSLAHGLRYYYRYVVWNHYMNCPMEVRHFETPSLLLPSLSSVIVDTVGTTLAGFRSEVIDDGGTEVMERGFCWSTGEEPSLSDSVVRCGTGTGEFVATITGLEPNTAYHVRAYAKNSVGTAYGEAVRFMTLLDISLPEVVTSEVTDITQTTATASGEVVADGGDEVTARGFCWSTSHNPTTSGNHATSGTGMGSFTVNMTGLTAETTYYVRAYAKNSQGTAYGTEKSFTTQQPYVITVSANPSAGGTVSGSGNYTQGQSCTVTATASANYTFLRWTENGTQVSENASYQFTVTGSRTLVAQFQLNTSLPTVETSQVTSITQTTAIGGGNVTDDGNATVTERGICWSTSHNPTTSGNHATSGAGTGSFTINMTGLIQNTTYYVRAYAINSTGTAYGEEKDFTTQSPPPAPTGAIEGLFSVSSSEQVWFSQGNLQYIGSASTPYWKFAEHQWDYLGNNGQGSTNQNVDRDLFGWGTSGWNNGNTYYRPYDTDKSNGSLYGPPGTYNLTGSYGRSDWGFHNAIQNGGNQTGKWRTLTHEEWQYVFNTRSTSSGIRYAKAIVNNVNGMILLPDDWNSSYYSLSNTNQGDANYSSNMLTSTQWTTLEQHGAVFLPAAGYRDGTTVGSFGSNGQYWSATSGNSSYFAWCVRFYDTSLSVDDFYSRSNGRSVRLVRSVQ